MTILFGAVILSITFLLTKGRFASKLLPDFELSLVIISGLLISNISWETHLVQLLFPIILITLNMLNAKKIDSKMVVLLIATYTLLATNFNFGGYGRTSHFDKGIGILFISVRLYGVLLLYLLCSIFVSKLKAQRAMVLNSGCTNNAKRET